MNTPAPAPAPDLQAFLTAHGAMLGRQVAEHFGVSPEDCELLTEQSFLSKTEEGKVVLTFLHPTGFLGVTASVAPDGTPSGVDFLRI
jgi:hypothetical protein